MFKFICQRNLFTLVYNGNMTKMTNVYLLRTFSYLLRLRGSLTITLLLRQTNCDNYYDNYYDMMKKSPEKIGIKENIGAHWVLKINFRINIESKTKFHWIIFFL